MDYVAVDETGAWVAVEGRDDAGGLDERLDEGSWEGGFFVAFGDDACQGGVGGLDAAGDGAVEHPWVGEEVAAPARDPYFHLVVWAFATYVRREMSTTSSNPEQRRGEALNAGEVPGAENAEVLAVSSGQYLGKEVAVNGRVHGLLERIARVGALCQRYGLRDMVHGEGRRPGHLRDDIRVDEPVGPRIRGEQQAVVRRVVVLEAQRDAEARPCASDKAMVLDSRPPKRVKGEG